MNAISVLKSCADANVSLSTFALHREAAENGFAESEILARFEQMFAIMETSATRALAEPVRSVSGLTGGDAYRYERHRVGGTSILGNIPAKAVAFALSCSEVNASMGRIVACPTAGSCGIVPAAVLAVVEEQKLPREAAIRALICAGLVGQIIGEHACLSGAQGGCQAECGSASAMAAAAVVELLGGSPEQSFHAGAIAIKNSLGLVCDPVAGLVEIPCIKRNAGGVINALAAADMALAGVESRIPFDDTVDAMNRIGHALPAALRETAGGGLATTKTGLALAEVLKQA